MSVSESLKPSAFKSAVLKVKRANQHINEIERQVRAATDAGACKIFAKFNPEAEATDFAVEFSQQALIASRDAELIAGDVIHNLRSALDHLAYAIMAEAGEYPTHMYFPIDVEPKSFVGQSTFREIQRVAPDIADLIFNEIKPYGARNPFVKLNQLDRIDKHRLLVVTMVTSAARVYVANHDDDVPDSAEGSFILVAGPPTRPPIEGTKAAAHNERNRYAAFDICFGAGQPFENESVIPTLHQLAQLVSGVIQTLVTYCAGKQHGRAT